jgi:hypothetical protein
MAVAAAAAWLFSLSAAHAFTFAEGTDTAAAPLIDNATTITPENATPSGSEFLTTITGSAASGDADLYAIRLLPGTFTASTLATFQSGGSEPGEYNAQLFLFDANGVGLTARDGGSGGSSELVTLTFTVPTEATYYLAISGFDFDPTAAPVAGSPFIFPNTNEPVNNNPLSGWAFFSGDAGTVPQFNYTISLTNAQPAPEPTTGGLLATLVGLGIISRRRH